MSALDTLFEKIKNHTEHHYKVLADETHAIIKQIVTSEDKKDLYFKILENISHSYDIDPYHEDDHAIEKLQHLLEKIQKHIDSLTESKVNESWILYNVDLKKHKIYNIYTKAWKYRGGKIYNCDKHFVILSWTAEVTTHDWDEDVKTVVIPGQIVKIWAETPNIFYFSEDTEMLEWFDKDAIAEKYERYYNLKK